MSTLGAEHGTPMKPFGEFPAAASRRVRFVLTDMDDTLTFRGRLSSATYDALERLDRAGIVVVPVTAAPAGWCDLMARQWPVQAVIGENGGVHFRRDRESGAMRREFWLPAEPRARSMVRLREIAGRILSAAPEARLAADQPYRQTTWAIEPSGIGAPRAAMANLLAAAWRQAGARCTINSLWVLGWFGDFDKLAMSRRLLAEIFSIDLAADRDAVLYVGDSLNDEPMFRFFPNSVGVATIVDYLDRLSAPPRWVTTGPGGSGFVEVAETLLLGRASR
jgi:HAD superfamily hydrolase (TIGR01484 family)